MIEHAIHFEVAEVAGQRNAEVEGQRIHLASIVAVAKGPEEVPWDFEIPKPWIPNALQELLGGFGGDVASVDEGAGDAGSLQKRD